MNDKTVKRGRFIVVDGPDGAGKTTQVKLLVAELSKRGIAVNPLREPGGTALGEAVRALLLDQDKIRIDALAEAFLFQAARAQLMHQIARPALEFGEWLVCDRFTLSTLVYQGYAGGTPKSIVASLSTAAADGVKPDAYFVLWVPATVGAERRASRTADRMESKGDAYLERVSSGFYTEAKQHGDKYTLVDGRGDVEAVRKVIWEKIEPLL